MIDDWATVVKFTDIFTTNRTKLIKYNNEDSIEVLRYCEVDISSAQNLVLGDYNKYADVFCQVDQDHQRVQIINLKSVSASKSAPVTMRIRLYLNLRHNNVLSTVTQQISIQTLYQRNDSRIVAKTNTNFGLDLHSTCVNTPNLGEPIGMYDIDPIAKVQNTDD